MTFNDLGLHPSILRAVSDCGYTNPTPIQEQAIPILLERTDLLGCAQTGTGKTAAFAIPIIQHLLEDKYHTSEKRRPIKALIVTPTRELAIQIKDSFESYSTYTDLRTTVIFGGVKQGAQVNTLKQGVDILVATPGRLLDLMQQGYISLKDVAYFVLDEADQMLDMGFIHDIKRLLPKLPPKRHSLFFSATMPEAIVKLSRSILGNYKQVTIEPKQTTAQRVSQSVYHVLKKDKINLLIHLLNAENYYTTIVFSRTKHGADKIAAKLKKAGIGADAIHGNKTQNTRQRTLNNFKEGKLAVLVATDIAARGIDIDDLSLVINYDLPSVAETYVHRIGRTGRASASGISMSFCDVEEQKYLRDIEKLIGKSIEVIEHDFAHSEPIKASNNTHPQNQKSQSQSNPSNKKRRPNKQYRQRGRSTGNRQRSS